MKHINGRRYGEDAIHTMDPSLLTVQNVKANDTVNINYCPSLLELSTTVRGRIMYVSFTLRQ